MLGGAKRKAKLEDQADRLQELELPGSSSEEEETRGGKRKKTDEEWHDCAVGFCKPLNQVLRPKNACDPCLRELDKGSKGVEEISHNKNEVDGKKQKEPEEAPKEWLWKCSDCGATTCRYARCACLCTCSCEEIGDLLHEDEGAGEGASCE